MPDPLESAGKLSTTEPDEAVAQVREAYRKLTEEIAKVIVGQDHVVESLAIVLFSGSHCLLNRRRCEA